MAEPDRATYVRMSDAELRALEKDGSLSATAWQAVMEELRRREQGGGARGAAPPRPAAAGAPPAPAIEEPDDARVAQALREIEGLLVPGETLQAWAVQRRLFALVHRRQLVAATSGRCIVVSRGLFGGYTPADVRWQDLEDADLKVGIFGATLSVTVLNQPDLASAGHVSGRLMVPGLRKEQAERVYRVAQAQEQAWREKRRVRDLDELRARAGGVQIGARAGGAGGALDSGGDPMARLQRAREMRDQGLITDAEFESIKARIVDRL